MNEKQVPTPTRLKELQYWFGGIIGQPIDINNNMNPVTPSGLPIEIEAAKYILPSLTLTPHQRIEIYNQQYWWRLLGIMHETFPFLTRLFGHTDFNQKLGIPYLHKHVPTHWALHPLGNMFPQWIDAYYHETDKELVLSAALIDYAYNNSFVAPPLPPVTLDQIGDILDKTLYLQSHVYVFNFNYPFFDFRKEMMTQEPEYWEENDFPPLEKIPTGYILWRDCYENIGWITLEPAEIAALQKFQDGCSLNSLCDWLAKQPKHISVPANNHLQEWTERWFVNEWLTIHKTSSYPSLP